MITRSLAHTVANATGNVDHNRPSVTYTSVGAFGSLIAVTITAKTPRHLIEQVCDKASTSQQITVTTDNLPNINALKLSGVHLHILLDMWHKAPRKYNKLLQTVPLRILMIHHATRTLPRRIRFNRAAVAVNDPIH